MHRLRVVATRQKWPLIIGTITGSSTSVQRSYTEETKKTNDGKEQAVFDLTKQWSNGPAFFEEFVFSEDQVDQTHDQNSQSIGVHTGSVHDTPSSRKPPTNLQELFAYAFPDETAKTKGMTSQQTTKVNDQSVQSSLDDWFALARDFGNLMSGNSETKEKAVQDLIVKARESIHSGDIQESHSFSEILSVMETDMGNVQQSLDKTFSGLDLGRLFPTSLFYYLEHQDEVKNPSWKRRMHRFFRGIDIRKVTYLNDQLFLATLAYADTVEDIREGLKSAPEEMELVYCETKGLPGKPAHFIALKKNQSVWTSELDVVIAVRGTKTFTDVMTDCLVDSAPYRDGKAHNGILASGKYIANKHLSLLQKLRKIAKKRTVKLTLVGHSLGAGAASIAGMELQRKRNMSVQVVGFGCPSLLSKELSQSTSSYITTVIADDDIVPRMSAATINNILLDITEYDWTHMAQRDIEHSLKELQRISPGLISQSTVRSILERVQTMLQTYVRPNLKEPTTERKEVELFPPGVCVHIYRDGSGVSGAIAPCDFFGEITISRRMIDDHLTESGYQRVFLDLMRQYYSDQHYKFEGTAAQEDSSDPGDNCE